METNEIEMDPIVLITFLRNAIQYKLKNVLQLFMNDWP